MNKMFVQPTLGSMFTKRKILKVDEAPKSHLFKYHFGPKALNFKILMRFSVVALVFVDHNLLSN